LQAWLKAIGHARGPLPAGWYDAGRARSQRRTAFPRRPRIARGDVLVYYASVWKRVFAVVDVTSDPFTVEHPRWPWAVDVAPRLVVPDLEDAPHVEAIGVAPRSMSQQSHIRLRERHLELAREAIATAHGARRMHRVARG
jgi:hypothetical protein